MAVQTVVSQVPKTFAVRSKVRNFVLKTVRIGLKINAIEILLDCLHTYQRTRMHTTFIYQQ